jgi:hypothetical protein
MAPLAHLCGSADAFCSHGHIQLDPCTILSSTALLVFPMMRVMKEVVEDNVGRKRERGGVRGGRGRGSLRSQWHLPSMHGGRSCDPGFF